MNAPIQQSLYLWAPTPDRDKPFAGDLFERQQLADRLTGLIARLPDGAVVAIDHPGVRVRRGSGVTGMQVSPPMATARHTSTASNATTSKILMS